MPALTLHAETDCRVLFLACSFSEKVNKWSIHFVFFRCKQAPVSYDRSLFAFYIFPNIILSLIPILLKKQHSNLIQK